MTPRAFALAAHVDALCKHYRIGVQYQPGKAYAWQMERRIRVPPGGTDVSYAVALHELGHILGKWQTRPLLISEVGAWRWAKGVALFWTPVMDGRMRDCLESYVHNTKVDHEMLPNAKHWLWTLLGRGPTEDERRLIRMGGM